MRRSAVLSLNDAADSGGSANKRRALSEIPLVSYDMEPAYCCPSIPAHCVVNGDDVSVHLQGDMRCRRYAVVYGRVSTRKHKRWEGDGVLVCRDRFAMLQTEDGKDIARVSAFSKRHLDALEPGHRLVIGGFELEVQEEFHGESECENLSASSRHGSASAADMKPISADDTFQSASGRIPSCSSGRKLGRKFVQPLLRTHIPSSSYDFVVNKNEVDVSGEDAVVLDGPLARHLRPHQKEGLTFLFRRLKDPGGGVILADEMGLGKSVQAISLLWILLKQLKQKGATSMKFILIAPTSLIGNWRCEFNKWLPHSEQLLFPVTKTSEVRKFMAYSGYSPVLLISYDVVVRCAELLEKISFALMICDEAHRLKNFNGNLRQSVSRLRTERRLLLTGTPIQNDMSEFFSLLDLAKPAAFGSLAQFRSMMANEDGMHDIQLLLSEILLRRTADVNFNNLPPRHEYVLWCRLSKVQQLIYNRIIGLASSDHLAIIDMLRKLCNHPSILYQSLTSKHGAFNSCESTLNATVLRAFPSSFEPNCSTIVDSGKLSVFVKMMVSLRETNEKVVVVSNFTKTLDMLSEVCKGIFCTVTRLDGSVVPHRRMQLVDEFNTSSLPNHVFLLSTKAGGVGLNLIGASRLVLFDSDWNPAFDVQAMARIWRDGQKMPCHIYRLVTAGTIDEKILQRQVMKSGLGTVVELDSLNERRFPLGRLLVLLINWRCPFLLDFAAFQHIRNIVPFEMEAPGGAYWSYLH
uniref:DNA repair and recombination protein RAD54-like n=1 Tax=Ascaris suum TaxID=6253 RepID=F1KX53_ASCSU